jgi:hypothetical protein
MGLRTTAASTIGGMITAIRIPADVTLSLVGRAPLGGALQGAVESTPSPNRRPPNSQGPSASPAHPAAPKPRSERIEPSRASGESSNHDRPVRARR